MTEPERKPSAPEATTGETPERRAVGEAKGSKR